MKNHLLQHLHIVNKHRRFVCAMCFKMGIPWQGLVHDLSKYSVTELSISKYYVGSRSPHEVAREQLGYSPSWMHHKHKNKHHWEYWLDNSEGGKIIPVKMPFKYLIEMFCDMVGAGKAYLGKSWTQHSPYQYWQLKCENKRLMHKQSQEMLVKLLLVLNDYGEKQFIKWYRRNRKHIRKVYDGRA